VCIATSEAAKGVVWIRNFVSKLSVVPNASSPMDLYCDNSGATSQAKETRSYKRPKHVVRHYYLICEIINRGDVRICMVHTD
jgi:hypothetical protein